MGILGHVDDGHEWVAYIAGENLIASSRIPKFLLEESRARELRLDKYPKLEILSKTPPYPMFLNAGVSFPYSSSRYSFYLE